MKTYDLGHRSSPMAMPEKPSKPKPYYPSLSLSEKDFPPLKDKGIGDVCRFVVTAHVVGLSEREGSDGGCRYDLELRRAEPVKDGNPGKTKGGGY